MRAKRLSYRIISCLECTHHYTTPGEAPGVMMYFYKIMCGLTDRESDRGEIPEWCELEDLE